MANKLEVTLTRSVIGRPEDQRQTVTALGLRKMHQTVEHQDNPAIRGMIKKVAVCGGAGVKLLSDAITSNCDAFLTSDISYHTF